MAKNSKKVYSFEPDPINFEILSKNIEINKIENVIKFNKAVYNKTGKINLFKCEFNRGMHRVYPSKWCENNGTEVDCIKIDDMIHEIDTISFVKIDTEGAEFWVLDGMNNLIQRDYPNILLEFHPPSIEESKCSPKRIYDMIKSWGYKIRTIGNYPKEINNYDELDSHTRYNVAENIFCFI